VTTTVAGAVLVVEAGGGAGAAVVAVVVVAAAVVVVVEVEEPAAVVVVGVSAGNISGVFARRDEDAPPSASAETSTREAACLRTAVQGSNGP
jgi:hypothetical protein